MTGNYPTRITTLTVTNFRCFKHADVDFGNLTAITGDSGTGKTSLIAALNFLVSVADIGLKMTVDAFGGYARLAHRVGQPVTIKVSGCFTDNATIYQPDTYTLSFTEDNSRVLLRDEDWRYPMSETADSADPVGGFTVKSGSGAIVYRHPKGSDTEVCDPWITGLHVLSQFRGTTSAEITKLAGVLSAMHRISVNPALAKGSTKQAASIYLDPDQTYPVPPLHSDASNLSAVLHSLKGPHQPVANRIFADMRHCYPWLRGYHGMERDSLTSTFIEEPGRTIPLENASQGMVRMLALLTACITPNPAPITVLDNLDGLSQTETQTLVAVLREAAKQTQIIALGSPVLFNPYAEDFDVYRIAERDHSGEITWSQ